MDGVSAGFSGAPHAATSTVARSAVAREECARKAEDERRR
jgi:hypothetical protein